MTGGTVVILGDTGRNFAAGMSGGVAYVYDKNGDFETKCNKEMVSIEGIEDEDQNILNSMIQKHLEYTDSTVARNLLDNWADSIANFVKVMPNDYKRMLQNIQRVTESGLSGDEAMMAAFEANKSDLARVSGN